MNLHDKVINYRENSDGLDFSQFSEEVKVVRIVVVGEVHNSLLQKQRQR